MSLENYGNYQLVKKLAMGGMAQIYLARRKGPDASGELVVVKRILPHLAENLEFVRMFLDEARIAARLAHPNIVQIHDLGAQDDSFFLAMEYIHGEDVRRMSKRADAQGRPLPVPLACRIISDACAGLDYAHKKTDPSGKPLGIVHRDVSPQNILVSFEGAVKVVDFGIAKAADQATVTRSGVLKGKYSYMSPEQANGQRVDCRSDVFALGVVLYELVTSTRLFKRPSDMQTLNAVAECHVTPPSQVSPRVPPELDAIIMKALAKDPNQRYAEALQLQLALEEWLSARRHAASPADLSAFMRELYAERIAREARAGTVVVDDEPPATGQRTALEGGNRRSGAAPSVTSREVTRADRGELIVPAAVEPVEVTDRTAQQRPSRPLKAIEPRREEPERVRTAERRSLPPRTPPVGVRRPDPEASVQTHSNSNSGANADTEALSLTDMTLMSSGGARKRRWTAIIAASVSAVAVALFLGLYLKPGGLPWTASARPRPVPPVAAQLPSEVKVPPPEVKEPPVVAKAAAQPVVAKEPPQPVTPPAPAAPVQVQLTLETEPPKATIHVDGEERGSSPLVVAVKAEQELVVSVSAPQHRTVARKLKVGTGPSQLERFTLEPLVRSASTPPASIKQTRVDSAPKPPPEASKAMVRFAVTPWAEVSCGGRNLGTTPFDDVALPVGVYQCRFHNPDLGRTLTQRIEVKATGMNKVVVKF